MRDVDPATLAAAAPRDPCPCGSGRRYKACHGHGGERAATPPSLRPFAGRVDEPEWVALREVVPAATAPLRLTGEWAERYGDRQVTLATVLPMAWGAVCRGDGSVLVGLQVPARSGDVSRDVAAALLAALDAQPRTPVIVSGTPGPGPRLQDLLDPAPLEIALHEGFDFWLDGIDTADRDEDVAASMERANAQVVPTRRVAGVPAAYWCRIGERRHLRWALPDEEDATLDAMARLAGRGELSLGEGTRYVGSFRAHGLLVPVWDLPDDVEAADLEEPLAALRGRLDGELVAPRPLTPDERRARAGLVSRQLTLR